MMYVINVIPNCIFIQMLPLDLTIYVKYKVGTLGDEEIYMYIIIWSDL